MKTFNKNNFLEKYKEYFVKKRAIPKDKLSATFLGVSSILFSDGKNSILIDGFVSRPSIQKLLFSKIKSDEEQITKTIDKLGLKKVDAIIPLHSHHDHAMDCALFAEKLSANIIGSSSTLNIAKAYDINVSKLIEIDQKASFTFGAFEITILPSKHTRMSPFLSFLTGIGEKIKEPISKYSYFTSYKEGGTYTVFIKHRRNSIFVTGSTNYLSNLEGLKADTIFLGIAKLGDESETFRENYYKTVVKNFEAKRVIPVHWDDFTRSIDEPIKPLSNYFDNFDKSIKFLITKSKEDNFELKLMNFYDVIVFE